MLKSLDLPQSTRPTCVTRNNRAFLSSVFQKRRLSGTSGNTAYHYLDASSSNKEEFGLGWLCGAVSLTLHLVVEFNQYTLAIRKVDHSIPYLAVLA
jgi:hypothetical protein